MATFPTGLSFFHENVIYFENKTRKMRKTISANLESCILFRMYFIYIYIKLPENDWLVKTNNFLIGDFMFLLKLIGCKKTISCQFNQSFLQTVDKIS